jgi:hypothetical protein
MQRIIAPLQFGDTSPAVANLQDGLLRLLRRQVIQVTDEERRFCEDGLLREQREQNYNDITRKLVAIFQEQQQLNPGNDQGNVDAPTAEALNRLLQELGAFDRPEWLVRGNVEADGNAVAGVLVRVSDRDLQNNQLLGEAVTNRLGAFEIVYTTADFARGDIASNGTTIPDLLVELSRDGQQLDKFEINRLPDNSTILTSTLVSEDDRLMGFQARNIETVRIVLVSVEQKTPLTLFEQLILAITPLLGDSVIADATDLQREAIVGAAALAFNEENSRDISFTARETGFDKNLIAVLQIAFRQSQQFESVPAWAFFGLAAQNVLPDAVIAMTQESLVLMLTALQPSYRQDDLEAVALSLKQFFKEQNISNEAASLKASVGDLLQPILGTEEKLSFFLDAYARHEGEIETFWDQMLQHPEVSAVVPQIQLNLQLSQLTLNNKGLINALQQSGIQNTRQLVDIPTERWEELALEHRAEMPTHISAESDLARAKIYAQELQTLVEMAFPTDSIKKSIQQPQVRLFLDNNPEFDFTNTPVEAYLQNNGEEIFRGVEQAETVKTHLRQMQRLYNVTANATDMRVLMDAGFESAYQIANLTAEDFRQRLDGRILDKNVVFYHGKAVAVSETTAMIYMQARDFVGSLNFAGAGGSLPSPDVERPDLKSLFGSLDTCECEHCKSVYSPAAYFVDLLHILLGQKDGAARKELFLRRPDLKYTKLTCQHTDTLIPYIDLVNEILETYVAQSNIYNPVADAHAKAVANDTSSFTAAELAANPQHTKILLEEDSNPAYIAINEKAVYPLNLPFDMNLEVARQFLLKQNSSRFDVLHTFAKSSPIVVAAERIGISVKELGVLTLKQLDGSPAQFDNPAKNITVNELWGNPTVLTDLAKVSEFIDRANITYAELIELLHTQFLNPNFPINVLLQELPTADRLTWIAANPDENQKVLLVIELGATDIANPCDLDKTLIKHLDGNFLSEAELSLFNRFIRLWKKIGCTIAELDGLLLAIGAADITAQVIQDLSVLCQLKQDLDLPLEQIAVLIGNIPAAGKESLYAKLFLNKAILQIDPKFELKILQTTLKITYPPFLQRSKFLKRT